MSSEFDKVYDNLTIGWKTAIRDAKAGIFQAKARIRELQKSIRTFEKKLKHGEPWPGEKA
jgi:hypothetical protein